VGDKGLGDVANVHIHFVSVLARERDGHQRTLHEFEQYQSPAAADGDTDQYAVRNTIELLKTKMLFVQGKLRSISHAESTTAFIFLALITIPGLLFQSFISQISVTETPRT
jgi:hypothetical protein